MSHPNFNRRRELKMYDRVCRSDDPRHVGIVTGLFFWKRRKEWTANVRWLDSDWHEYVPMARLIFAEEDNFEYKELRLTVKLKD
jgi:hypothetical protein